MRWCSQRRSVDGWRCGVVVPTCMGPIVRKTLCQMLVYEYQFAFTRCLVRNLRTINCAQEQYVIPLDSLSVVLDDGDYQLLLYVKKRLLTDVHRACQ